MFVMKVIIVHNEWHCCFFSSFALFCFKKFFDSVNITKFLHVIIYGGRYYVEWAGGVYCINILHYKCYCFCTILTDFLPMVFHDTEIF